MKYAVVAGNNRGVERSAALRYAERDAERFAEVLTDVGGFDRGRVTLLAGASASEFRTALAKTDGQIRAASLPPARAMVVLYFSGHADGINLELGSDLVPFTEIRKWVESVPAGIKIAFIDSCLSGALTQVKGGRIGPSFDITVTDQLDVSGTAIVTSSARGEHSQESHDLGGSFFTTYLISGFRGAADANGDGKVTLAEVYQYAFGKTATATAKTVAGVQHPTYDFKIAGKGEVVLSTVADARASLLFGPACAGSFTVIDAHKGEVAAEVSKPEGARRLVALRPGEYLVAQQREGSFFSQRVALDAGARVEVDPAAMQKGDMVAALTKGNTRRRSGWEVMAGYGITSGLLSSIEAASQGIAGVRTNLGPVSVLPRFSYSQAKVDDVRLNMHYFMHMFSLESYVAWRFELPFLDVLAGANVGAGYNRQKYANQTEYAATAFIYGPAAGINVPIGAGFSAQTFFELDFYVLYLDNKLTQTNSLKGTFGVGYEF
ncbi:MAG: caspase family protein [Deltaproteobacteria bacterium]|nr:caspase family protein [Deltaproteobacteria bacterium]